AFLRVLRRASTNSLHEQGSREILELLGTFSRQWGKYTDSLDKVRRQLDTVSRSFDDLSTTRRRALERPLLAIDDLRRKQSLPVADDLFGEEPDTDDDDGLVG